MDGGVESAVIRQRCAMHHLFVLHGEVYGVMHWINADNLIHLSYSQELKFSVPRLLELFLNLD